jgi:predicted nucleic acid-binding protein
VIIDASVVLRAFFPDEEGQAQAQAQAIVRAYVLNALDLAAPTLLPYEVTNAILQAVRRGRVEPEIAEQTLATFEELEIPTVEPSLSQTLTLARRYDRSVYDAAYLALAQERGAELITGDRRLYNAVHEQLPWVIWIEEYVAPASGLGPTPDREEQGR